MPPPGKRSIKERLTAAQRQQRAVELVAAGNNLDQVAAELGYADRSGAYVAIQAVLNRADYAAADGLRNIQGARLLADELELMRLWRDTDRPLDQRLRTFDRLLRCRERQSRLFGLDAPVKVDATVRSETDAAIAELAEQLGLQPGPVPAE